MTCVSEYQQRLPVCIWSACGVCNQLPLLSDVTWNSANTLAISGRDTIQRRNAAGFSVRPTAPPSPLTCLVASVTISTDKQPGS